MLGVKERHQFRHSNGREDTVLVQNLSAAHEPDGLFVREQDGALAALLQVVGAVGHPLEASQRLLEKIERK